MASGTQEPTGTEIFRKTWTLKEDEKLKEVAVHGARNWPSLASKSGLNRNAQSCRDRWVNYLRANLKRGDISGQVTDEIKMSSEEDEERSPTSAAAEKQEPSERKFFKKKWTLKEDEKLNEAVAVHGAREWPSLASNAGLNRNGHNCRMRWVNYLRPNALQRGGMSDQVIDKMASENHHKKKWTQQEDEERLSTRANVIKKVDKKPTMASEKPTGTKIFRKLWTLEEDEKLKEVVAVHGARNWQSIASKEGLNRCGKRYRLRWVNYLRPDLKRGDISDQEKDLIVRLTTSKIHGRH